MVNDKKIGCLQNPCIFISFIKICCYGLSNSYIDSDFRLLDSPVNSLINLFKKNLELTKLLEMERDCQSSFVTIHIVMILYFFCLICYLATSQKFCSSNLLAFPY
ncbi:hypothetical protein ACOSP7_015585 [Xanthoceras sorbifolium]